MVVPYQTVFEGAHVRAVCFNADAARLRVRLSYRRDAEVGFDAAEPQGAAIKAGYANLWVQAAQNDYYISPDLPALRRALHGFCARYRDVSAVGFSMGGFGAVLLSRALHLTQAVLVSPQRLGFPKAAPFASDDAQELACFTTDDPNADLDGISPDLRGVVMFDPFAGKGRDRAYARHLGRIVPGLRLLALPGAGHPATNVMVEAKKFMQFQQATFVPQIEAADIRAVHRASRSGSERYETMVLKYMSKRMMRD